MQARNERNKDLKEGLISKKALAIETQRMEHERLTGEQKWRPGSPRSPKGFPCRSPRVEPEGDLSFFEMLQMPFSPGRGSPRGGEGGVGVFGSPRGGNESASMFGSSYDSTLSLSCADHASSSGVAPALARSLVT